MKILVIGSGGREHAIAWKLSKSPRVQSVFVAPGNAGIARDKNLTNIDITNIQELRAWATQEHIALTVVGPEAPLAQGVVDEFTAHGLRIFGPTQAAAQLESSKAFSKAFMSRHAIPTARYESFTDRQAAHEYVKAQGAPIVIKADGLAAGKGVVVAMTLQEAHDAVDYMLTNESSGVQHNGQARVVIEEFLQGEEASFIVISDGMDCVALATCQDHKRLNDQDLGPNTGGMGAYSPAPVVTPQIHAKAMREIIMPTLKGMMDDGIPYSGFLYAGLMISKSAEVKCLEFNCRLGDPETQPIMMRLQSDLVDVLMSATQSRAQGARAAHESSSPKSHNDGEKSMVQMMPAEQKIFWPAFKTLELEWDRRPALGVVMAAKGYPSSPEKGALITGLPNDKEDVMVFHAGTSLDAGTLKVSGGRVLCVTALGGTLKLAQQLAYAALDQIAFEGAQFRRDIGYRALQATKA
jgi:phosphoribosylamine--glycine ligase